ncbi:hypothetical protein Mgra_00005173 [Meloidogyne graminicola]|uniref:Uncharacterized protein n=1 Tax=Meloidogyne graminicola TaxID=189291 RepID=A0A8S9ZQ21_9BILA|nr:hypothetical protein Mgra_00005173 [Meloidogyne graminicola]
MQQQSPTKSIIIKNECSSDNQNKFEAIITLKILANETGKEIWKDVCLTTERDTIGKMVKHVQEKFIPAEYLNKSLKLRNVTIFSERFGLEVSVAVDGLATDGAKYTANFLNSQNLTERAVDQRFNTTSNLQKKSEDQGKSLTDVEKKYKEKMDLLMKTERDLLKANKQKQTALDDLKLAEKNAKEKSEALKEAQNALDKVRDEKKRLQIDVAQLEKSKKDLGNYLKDMREMSAKKTKDLDKLNKDLEKLEKKRKGMLHQMDVYKKELDAELDGMNKLNTTREKTNSEIENLKNEKQKCKTSLESLKKSEEECRKNLEHLQEEEKKFYLMLNELKEQVHIHQTQLQELQGRENEKNLNENFGLVYGQNGNNNFGEVQQNFNGQSEFNCKGGQQQRGDGNEC